MSLVESLRRKIVETGVMDEKEIDGHMAALSAHLDDPGTVVIEKLLVQAWGRKPQ